MGGTESKVGFRRAIVNLTGRTNQTIDTSDDAFWDQFWSGTVNNISDIFALVTAEDIHTLREESPANFMTLIYKAVEKLDGAVIAGPSMSPSEQAIVLNCVRLLTRLVPFVFESEEWRSFFWSKNSMELEDSLHGEACGNAPLAQILLKKLSDLLFCPDFTIVAPATVGPDTLEDFSIESIQHIWEKGVGFAYTRKTPPQIDSNRTEILKLVLTCFSETMYYSPQDSSQPNLWLSYFTSNENKHALPLFTSLLNVICAYDPQGYGLPYQHVVFNDTREQLVEVSAQVLMVILDHESASMQTIDEKSTPTNYFTYFLSRIHREEDFAFILSGLIKLLNNPLMQTYLPNSCKKIGFHEELLVLFWKMCDYNKKFLFYVLKTSDVLDVLVPILYYLTESRNDPGKVGLMHVGVFILLLLSGERNFGVRLNKLYLTRVPMDLPIFTGNHADLLMLVFHKIITSGHLRLQPLFDCILTIIVNVSPYLKQMCMVSASKLMHLLEAFSTPWFLFANQTNYHLVFFLLEIFNNIIQYQFDGNAHLMYSIIRKRHVFHQLSNLPEDPSSVSRPASRRKAVHQSSESDSTTGITASTLFNEDWKPTSEWVASWRKKLPLQTIMRLLQVLVPQVEKICIDKNLTDESEIITFLQNGTLVGLLPVPHPILMRKYQPNAATSVWFRRYMWGLVFLRNTAPPIWCETNIKLFEVQKV